MLDKNNSSGNKLGIWMDHSNAKLIELGNDSSQTTTIVSKFTHQIKKVSLSRSESLMHHKEQQLQEEYYGHIANVILGFEKVILFGPTSAKEELFNVLKEDHRFEKIDIQIESADKMTENQQLAFVKNYFEY